MASYTATGAGDGTYNDTYSEAGTYDGQPYYVGAASARIIRWTSGYDAWIMEEVLGESGFNHCAYYHATDIPGPWTVQEGTPPAPTVTEYAVTGPLVETPWLSPTVAANPETGWNDPDNAKAAGAGEATYYVENPTEAPVSGYSTNLDLTGFGVTGIEAEDTIVGVAVGLRHWGVESTSAIVCYPTFAHLLVGGSPGGANCGQEATPMPTADPGTYEVLGGSGNGWGAGLTPADLDSDFGVRLQYEAELPDLGDNATFHLDHCRIKIWYRDKDGSGGKATKHVFMGIM